VHLEGNCWAVKVWITTITEPQGRHLAGDFQNQR
jgi:hypothetical protein